MARSASRSAGSQFFHLSRAAVLDKQYTAFGEVVKARLLDRIELPCSAPAERRARHRTHRRGECG